MKKCPFCGATIEENAKFCLYCMKELEKKVVYDKRPFFIHWKLLPIIATASALLIILAIILAVVFSGKKPSDTSSENAGSTAAGIAENEALSQLYQVPTSSQISESLLEEILTAVSDASNPDTTFTSDGSLLASDIFSSADVGSGYEAETDLTTSESYDSRDSHPQDTASANSTYNQGSTTSSVTAQKPTNSKPSIVASQTPQTQVSVPQSVVTHSNLTASMPSTITSINGNQYQSSSTSSVIAPKPSGSKVNSNKPQASVTIPQNSSVQSATAQPSVPQNTVTSVADTSSKNSSSHQSTAESETDSPQELKFQYRKATASDLNLGLYYVPDDNEVVITKVEGAQANGVYIIPQYIGDKKVCAVMANAFSDSSVAPTVKKVVVPKSVTAIWNYAFAGCRNMTDIYFLGNSIYLEGMAFDSAAGTTTINSSYTCDNGNHSAYRNLVKTVDGWDWREWDKKIDF